MGSGELIEQGNHQDLLRNPEGPYAQLVGGQKLKEEEQEPKPTSDQSSTIFDNKAMIDVDEVTAPPGPNKHEQDTHPTVSQKNNPSSSYGGASLFRRMALINKDVTNVYISGITAAISEVPASSKDSSTIY